MKMLPSVLIVVDTEVPMSRVQLALNVSDLEASVAFYSAMFATEPHKRRPGSRPRGARAASSVPADLKDSQSFGTLPAA